MNTLKKCRLKLFLAFTMIIGAAGMATSLHAADSSTSLSRYMGGPVELVTAPNGARVNAEVLEISPKICYLEPTTEKVADGVWCIGGYSLANTTVIEGDDGLIVYDTGDTREEAEHIRKAIEEISDKPVKVIIYSHSHYAMGAGALVDNPDQVSVREIDERNSIVLEVSVAQSDMGRVIGKGGSVVNSVRSLLQVLAAKKGKRVSLEIV